MAATTTLLLKNGWFEHLADGTPTNGLPYDRAGSDIDTTNPDAAGVVLERHQGKLRQARASTPSGPTRPSPIIPPTGSYFHAGPGTQFFNVYPLFHTAAFYNGMRKDMPERALILARDSYLGAQHNGAIFWSSDISPNWDTLQRSVPTGLDFVASGMPYWSTDIGGWQFLPSQSHAHAHFRCSTPPTPVTPSAAYDDYPELYTRWFEYGAFQPNFRSHGSRNHNEVWSYGKQAEPILEKYLRLRYTLMPYIYSLGWQAHETGAPFMRALFLDFGADPKRRRHRRRVHVRPRAARRSRYGAGPDHTQSSICPPVVIGITSGRTSVFMAASASRSPPPSIPFHYSFAQGLFCRSACRWRAPMASRRLKKYASIPEPTRTSLSTTMTVKPMPTNMARSNSPSCAGMTQTTG